MIRTSPMRRPCAQGLKTAARDGRCSHPPPTPSFFFFLFFLHFYCNFFNFFGVSLGPESHAEWDEGTGFYFAIFILHVKSTWIRGSCDRCEAKCQNHRHALAIVTSARRSVGITVKWYIFNKILTNH